MLLLFFGSTGVSFFDSVVVSGVSFVLLVLLLRFAASVWLVCLLLAFLLRFCVALLGSFSFLPGWVLEGFRFHV